MTASTHSTKKILILSSWYPTEHNPFLGNFIRQQAHLLSKYFDVTVLYFCTNKFQFEQRIDDYRSGRLREIIIHYPTHSNLWRKKRAIDKAFETGIKMIDRPDLIHGHCLLPKGHLFSKAKAHFKCPLVVTEHGSYFRKETRTKKSLKERVILSIAKSAVDRLIAVSDFQRKDLQKYFKTFPIAVVPNPIDTRRFKPTGIPTDQPIQFLHVSTLDKVLKNPLGIIEAVDLLCTKGYKQFHLRVVSDEPFDTLKMEVNRLKLDPYISFHGPLAHQELVAYYNQSHALVMFSTYETFSIVIAEAWACGIPVISTPVGIAWEMSDALGLTVPDNNPLSLALEMEKMINGKPFHRQLIREHALQFDNGIVLEQLVDIYNQLWNY